MFGMKKTRAAAGFASTRRAAAPTLARAEAVLVPPPAPAPRTTLAKHMAACAERTAIVLDEQSVSENWPGDLALETRSLLMATIGEACIPWLPADANGERLLDQIDVEKSELESAVPQRLFDDLARAQIAIARAGAAWLLKPAVSMRIEVQSAVEAAAEAERRATKKQRKRLRYNAKLLEFDGT